MESYEGYTKMIEQSGRKLKNVPSDMIDFPLALLALKRSSKAFEYIPDNIKRQHPEICALEVFFRSRNINHVPDEMRTPMLYRIALLTRDIRFGKQIQLIKVVPKELYSIEEADFDGFCMKENSIQQNRKKYDEIYKQVMSHFEIGVDSFSSTNDSTGCYEVRELISHIGRNNRSWSSCSGTKILRRFGQMEEMMLDINYQKPVCAQYEYVDQIYQSIISRLHGNIVLKELVPAEDTVSKKSTPAKDTVSKKSTPAKDKVVESVSNTIEENIETVVKDPLDVIDEVKTMMNDLRSVYDNLKQENEDLKQENSSLKAQLSLLTEMREYIMKFYDQFAYLEEHKGKNK